ncbi:MAG: AAA family ATPase [Fimbriimonadales bacterium]
MKSNLRFILTGGPGSGKTTALHLLESNGFTCVPEVARRVIQERINNGLSPRPSEVEFAQEILAADIDQYDNYRYRGVPIFFDRGIGDALAMLYQCNEIQLATAIECLKKRPYTQKLFFFPPWEQIFVNDEERDQSFAHCVEVSAHLMAWYESLGFSIVPVPLVSALERVSIIIKVIDSA